ncbi:PREDICTED: telomere repeat-binding protein 3 [Camelina sativa]|uniref:Telomere repeat-binding protein 3 n=1 Tax=Camelina sativa TaxID=90675 RepID=A0ABM0YD28_CAMSA|nr:PREDICTED: telomere repeat-binding protein 3 [Camelina sativa]XP_010499165.1 PREDICTED: telomere repeat-binding protein 3 [Camelina sativa]
MVFKRKLDCLSVGFDFPNIPRAPRSCRRKVLNKKIDDDYDTKICAIDLLALAGKLLQEKESESSSASSNAFEGNNHDVKQEQDDKCKPVKSEFSDQGNSVSRPTTYDNSTEKCVVNSFSFPDNDGVLERTPMSDYKMTHGSMALGCDTKNASCDSYVKSGGITGETGGVNVNTGFKQGEATDPLGDGGLITAACNLEDATALGVRFPKLVRVGGDLKLPSSMDMTPNGSFARHGNHTNLVRKDDDEKFFSYHKLSNKFKSYRSPSIRRIRKSLSSKYWKQVSKDFGHSRADVGVKTLYRKRRSCYGYNAWQRDIIYKRRRSPDRSSVVTSDGGLSSGSVSKLPEKGDTVKLSIKSFRIPELFIEVPETASVGSLKRTVMEAVGVLLSGGIRVGVLMHGKKVRDDRKTLSQTGISCDENLDNLGFTLEPGPGKVPLPLCSEDPAVPTDPTNLSERSPASPTLDSGVPLADDVINSGNIVKSNLDLVPYQSDISVDEPSSDSKALVPLPSLEVKALAIVPLNQKPKRAELAQRRTRRPFSVTEVEALVQAVEELGTGRWRDVKLRAFENADHRTYVDLKDKWKTLVHTASISPQQRRGEPVPQDLLDRVLRAYGYWSQHQGKHQARGASKDPDMNRGRALESGVSV